MSAKLHLQTPEVEAVAWGLGPSLSFFYNFNAS